MIPDEIQLKNLREILKLQKKVGDMLRSPMVTPPASCGFTGYLHDNAIKHESNIEFYLMQRIHTIEMVEKETNEAEVTFEEKPQPKDGGLDESQ